MFFIFDPKMMSDQPKDNTHENDKHDIVAE